MPLFHLAASSLPGIVHNTRPFRSLPSELAIVETGVSVCARYADCHVFAVDPIRSRGSNGFRSRNLMIRPTCCTNAADGPLPTNIGCLVKLPRLQLGEPQAESNAPLGLIELVGSHFRTKGIVLIVESNNSGRLRRPFPRDDALDSRRGAFPFGSSRWVRGAFGRDHGFVHAAIADETLVRSEGIVPERFPFGKMLLSLPRRQGRSRRDQHSGQG